MQKLAGGQAFLGYGQRPYFTQFDSAGQEDFDARFVTAQLELPRLSLQVERQAGEPAGGGGGTLAARRSTSGRAGTARRGVARWRVLAGPRPGSLRPVTVVHKRGFETAATIRGAQLRGRPGAGRQGPGARPVAHGPRGVNRDPTRPPALVH